MCYLIGMVGTWRYRTIVSLHLLLFHGDASVTESIVGRPSLTHRSLGEQAVMEANHEVRAALHVSE